MKKQSMRTVGWVTVLLTLFWVLDAAARSDIRVRGFVEVVDGDTLLFGEAEVHLYGLDAPELGQMCTRQGEQLDCGELSRQALAEIVRGKKVTCSRATQNTRYEGTCQVGSTVLNRELLKQGWAMVNYEMSNFYAGYQSIAQRKNLNLWSMQLQKPWLWRVEQNDGSDPERAHQNLCIHVAGSWKC